MTLKQLIGQYCTNAGQPPFSSDDLADFLTSLYIMQKVDIRCYRLLLGELEQRGAEKPYCPALEKNLLGIPS
ncbi:YppF family protein [Alteribacter natronophilus]|uniref:YppF family protein n=1 Tax=Alteribacter natronophilus TaxID=2583810 RepID=UPI00110E31E8|nr:YppF family protein [Alteribacter natronophilus]TMW73519.1 hypothetical protein FGB90_04255 [Alteribacter natronophilus]